MGGVFKRRMVLKRRTVCKKDLFQAKKYLGIRFHPKFQLKGPGLFLNLRKISYLIKVDTEASCFFC